MGELGIPHQVVHNASIMNAVGCCGLQLYNFGETVSIPFWTDSWKPDSFYQKIAENRRRGLHTLCLLDIKVKEISDENLARIGATDQKIVTTTVEKGRDVDMGAPLHSLV